MTSMHPPFPRPLRRLPDARPRVLTTRDLPAHGITPAQARERCRPGGPWQMLLPGVYLLHPEPPTVAERLGAALRFAAGPDGDGPDGPGPDGPGPDSGPDGAAPAVLTGPAALALHGFAAADAAAQRVDVLVPRTRRLRSAGWVSVVRCHALPRPVERRGFPVAPVPRALADAVGRATDAGRVRALLTEAVRGGHCDAEAVVRELSRARLLGRPHVADAVEILLAEGRAVAEGRLLALVREAALPDPCWNVDLRLPGGPVLGRMDAYWPDHGVAVEIDARASRRDRGAHGAARARRRETLERLGLTVIRLTPRRLRTCPELQATVIRTALLAAAYRPPCAWLVVLPRTTDAAQTPDGTGGTGGRGNPESLENPADA